MVSSNVVMANRQSPSIIAAASKALLLSLLAYQNAHSTTSCFHTVLIDAGVEGSVSHDADLNVSSLRIECLFRNTHRRKHNVRVHALQHALHHRLESDVCDNYPCKRHPVSLARVVAVLPNPLFALFASLCFACEMDGRFK